MNVQIRDLFQVGDHVKVHLAGGSGEYAGELAALDQVGIVLTLDPRTYGDFAARMAYPWPAVEYMRVTVAR